MAVIKVEEDVEVSPYNLLDTFTNKMSVPFGTSLFGRDFSGDILSYKWLIMEQHPAHLDKFTYLIQTV